jgi:hypothetical protein
MAYAADTTVPVERTRAEIETILRKYGAAGFACGWNNGPTESVARIDFAAKGKHVRFVLTLPSPDDKQFARTKHRYSAKVRTPEARHKAWEQACRQKWRALALCIKAKLEACDAGITQFEKEFLAQMVDRDTGKTFGELAEPWLAGHVTASSLLSLPSPDQAFREPKD